MNASSRIFNAPDPETCKSCGVVIVDWNTEEGFDADNHCKTRVWFCDFCDGDKCSRCCDCIECKNEQMRRAEIEGELS